jgi:hypothetical protein
MMQSTTPLLFLLEAIKSATVLETYHYFPGVIVAGDKCIERIDFEYLLAQHYIKETKADFSGKSYSLTDKAELILSDSVQVSGKEDIVYALN